MLEAIKKHPFSLIFVLLQAWVLSEYIIGFYLAVICLGAFFLSLYFLQRENITQYLPIALLAIILFVQLYALYFRLYPSPMEIRRGTMEAAIGGAGVLGLIIKFAPIFSIPPTLQLTKINKKYLLLIIPSLLIAGYWIYYLKVSGLPF